RLGGSRLAAATAAAVLGAAAAPWRAGGSGGVYGVALASLGCAWLLAARFVRAPETGAAALLGLGAGVAVGAHLENLAFVGAALVLVAVISPARARTRLIGAFGLTMVAAAAVIFVVTSGLATDWSIGGMRHWFLHPGIGGSVDRSSLVGWGVGGLFGSIVQ